MFYVGLLLIIFFLPWLIKSTGISIAAMIIGVLLMAAGWKRKKKKTVLDSAVSLSKEKFCTNCKVNVSDNTTKCPVCGKDLRGN